MVGRGAVERSCRWLPLQQGARVLVLRSSHSPGCGLEFGRQLGQGMDVLGGGATAATDYLHPEVFDKVH